MTSVGAAAENPAKGRLVWFPASAIVILSASRIPLDEERTCHGLAPYKSALDGDSGSSRFLRDRTLSEMSAPCLAPLLLVLQCVRPPQSWGSRPRSVCRRKS